MSRQRTPTREVRDALLRAARQLLDEHGPDALTIRDIAARAGVAPMGVYNRFGATSLELRNIGFISNRDTHYAVLINTVLRGIATPTTLLETELPV